MKTIVFAYSEFGCIGIEALVKAGYDIEAVFTYCDDPRENVFYRSVAQVCVQNNLRAYTLDKNNSAAWQEKLKAISPDYIFSFYYRELLPDSILALAGKGAFNLHGSLLPRYRGRAPVNWVLVKGETETGVTLHHMVQRADAGDIVAQKKVAIDDNDTAFVLQHKLLDAAKQMLSEQLPLIAQGKAKRIKQDITKGEYCGRRTPADGLIDWSQSAEMIRNQIRAVTLPYPGAFTWFEQQKILVWDSAAENKAHNTVAGTIISVNPLTIACGKGTLTIKAAQAGEEGLYVSGIQLAEALGLQTGTALGSASVAA